MFPGAAFRYCASTSTNLETNNTTKRYQATSYSTCCLHGNSDGVSRLGRDKDREQMGSTRLCGHFHITLEQQQGPITTAPSPTVSAPVSVSV